MGYHPGMVVYHATLGTGRVVNTGDGRVAVNFIKHGMRSYTEDLADEELSETPFINEEESDDVDTDELKEAIRRVILEEGMLGTVDIGERWEGGEMVLKPGKPGLQDKSVPIETFFHKIVMVRNQIRLMEQNINSSKSLTDAEKVELQQYVTRCYGSLTTFNVLFADRDDWFVGSKGKE